MSELRIRNWDKWQSYRGDRGQPPWIKIHRAIMRDPNWVELNDAQRGQLVAMWLLAADRNGVIPASPATLKKICFMDSDPDIQVFVDKGFIEPDANVTPERRQHDAPEKRQRQRQRRDREETDEKEGLRAEFDSYFYPAYPNKVCKPKALASFVSARSLFSLKTILDGLENYKRSKPPDRQWLNPATFLNQQRFNDEPASVAAPPPRLSRTQQAFQELNEERNGTVIEFGRRGICEGGGTVPALEFSATGPRSEGLREPTNRPVRREAEDAVVEDGEPTDRSSG